MGKLVLYLHLYYSLLHYEIFRSVKHIIHFLFFFSFEAFSLGVLLTTSSTLFLEAEAAVILIMNRNATMVMVLESEVVLLCSGNLMSHSMSNSMDKK